LSVNQLSGELGGGTLIRIKDGTMILQPEFRDYLIKILALCISPPSVPPGDM
jgi:putative aminopeptidase FrvX